MPYTTYLQKCTQTRQQFNTALTTYNTVAIALCRPSKLVYLYDFLSSHAANTDGPIDLGTQWAPGLYLVRIKNPYEVAVLKIATVK